MKLTCVAFLSTLGASAAFTTTTVPMVHRRAVPHPLVVRNVVTDPTETIMEDATTVAGRSPVPEANASAATPSVSADVKQELQALVDAQEVLEAASNLMNEPTETAADAVETTSSSASTSAAAPLRTKDLDPLEPGRFATLERSLALPMSARPAHLDGSHAGDCGFDPLGLTDKDGLFDLYTMQEAELRHARLAMLAVVGWPLSELIAPDFMLPYDGRAPSVLNGFNWISFPVVLGVLAAFGFFEVQTSLRRTSGTTLGDIHQRDMSKIWKHGVAGDYNFDPANLYGLLGDDARGRKAMRELEISHGRWAMVGITWFAMAEAWTERGITQDNLLFHPNLIVPLVAAAGFVWSQFFQLTDLTEYPVGVEYTKNGEERMRAVKRTFGLE